MTNEQLVIMVKSGIDEAENMLELWQQNRNFIYKLAMKYQGYAEIDDLMQEGYIGLCNAVEHYDPDKGIQFITYAGFWIKNAMQRYIDNCTGVIRLPVYARNEVQQYKKIVSEYRKWYGREPSDWEMAGFLGVNAEKLESIKKNVFTANIRSLSEAIGGEDEDFTLEDTAASDFNMEDDIIKRLDTAAMKKELWKAVDELPENYPDIIKYRYRDNLTMQETGERLGTSISQVRTMEGKALRQLREPEQERQYKTYFEQYMTAKAIRHIGYREFNRTWTSATELAAIEWCLNG